MTNKNKYLKYKYKYLNLKNKLNSYIGGNPNIGKIVYDTTGKEIGKIKYAFSEADTYILDTNHYISIKSEKESWSFEPLPLGAAVSTVVKKPDLDEEIIKLSDIKEQLIEQRISEPDLKIKEQIKEQLDDINKRMKDMIETHRQNILEPYNSCPEN